MRHRVGFPAAPAVAAWLVLLSAQPLAAQQPLTLQEAIAIAQQRGDEAAAARATRDAARFRARAFGGRLLPQLFLGGTVPAYNRSIVEVPQGDGTTAFKAQQRSSAGLTMTLTQKLPLTGGDFFVSSSLSRLRITGVLDDETWSATPVLVGLRQDLFRPNLTAWDQREQTVRSELDDRNHLEAMEDIALQVTNLFFDLYDARVGLANAVANAAVNDTLYTLNKGRFEVGRIGENDLLQSELVLLRSRAALDAARLTHARALATLRQALNLPPDAPLDVTVAAALPNFEPDTARAVAEALRNRASVSNVALQDVQARRRVTEARLAGGIGASVEASVGFNATAPAASLAYENLLDAQRFTLAVQVPLWQWGVHGAGVRAAEVERDRAGSLGRATLEQTGLEAHFAALQLLQARRNVALVAKADTVATKRFEVAYNRYVIGRIAIDNLYLAQSEKDQAMGQFAQALRGYWQAHYRLRRLTLFDFEQGQAIKH